MSGTEKAISSFRENFNCAQSVLSSFSNKYGLDEDTALRLSTGFGGGMGRMQNTCGAVTGAFMVIGLRYGRGKNEDEAAKEKTYEVIRKFKNRFQEIHGSIMCKDLLGCDINTPEGKDFYNRNDFFEKKCGEYVKDSAKILEEIL